MQEGIDWLNDLNVRGIKLGLESIKGLLAKLDNPQNGLSIIHVAGSDGKGSVCCMIESILMAAGYKVGMFNTPHILKVNECIRINGRDINDDQFDSLLLDVKKASESMECTNFEALTACAFLCFKREDVDFAVIEVGMGGREDATNVIVPTVSVINNISLEHTAFLGNTLAEIAYQKAGIMKKGVPCVTLNRGEALDALIRYSKEVGCELSVVDTDELEVLSNEKSGLLIRYQCKNYWVGIPGRYQARNAALAIDAVRNLPDCERIEQFINIGLEDAFWPYRMEKINDRVVLDVTHTREGAESLKENIPEIYGRVTLVTAMLNDKDLDGVAEILSEIADRVYVTSVDSPRAASKELLAESYKKFHGDVTVCDCIDDAMELALKNEGTVLVTGSFRTAEGCLRWLRRTQ